MSHRSNLAHSGLTTANIDAPHHRQHLTTVVNLRNATFDVYIGRAGRGFDGYFGNPYRLDAHGNAAIRLWVDSQR